MLEIKRKFSVVQLKITILTSVQLLTQSFCVQKLELIHNFLDISFLFTKIRDDAPIQNLFVCSTVITTTAKCLTL
jgi:hypothetical protein